MCVNELFALLQHVRKGVTPFKRKKDLSALRLNEDVHFVLHSVSSSFFEQSSFSKLTFSVAAYMDAKGLFQVQS